MSHNIAERKSTDFNEFFSGFKKYQDILIAYIIIAIIAAAIIVAFLFTIFAGVSFSAIMEGDISSLSAVTTSGWVILMAFIPIVYLAMLTVYITPFIYFYDLDGLTAIKYSARFVHSQWLYIFLFMMVVGILVSLGMIALFFGVLFTIGFMYTMTYSSFSGITHLEDYLDEDSDDHVLDMLIEE